MFHIIQVYTQLFHSPTLCFIAWVKDERKNDGVIIERLKVASNKELVKLLSTKTNHKGKVSRTTKEADR